MHTLMEIPMWMLSLNNGEEVLELLIEDYQAQGKPLPEPLTANISFQFVQSSP